MFKIFAASLIALSFSAFASETTCFKATGKVPAEVPATLCLEAIYEAGQPGFLNVDSRNQTIPYTLTVTDFRRHNEDKYKFQAEYVYVDMEDRSWHCADAREVKLVISGSSESATINPKTLTVKVEETESRDVCHDYGRTTEYKYELVK